MLFTFSTDVLRAVSLPTSPAASALPAVTMACLANPPAPPAPQAQAILLLEPLLLLPALLVLEEATVDMANQAAATAPQAHTALIIVEVL